MKRIIHTLSQKWPEYLVEILVITIGILGAFALNNWNEASKAKKTERELLVALHHDLGENANQMKRAIGFDSTIYTQLGTLIQILDSDESVYHDSLKVYFGHSNRYASFDPQRLAYESIKSLGFDVISDLDVRNEVIKLYDQDYSHLKQSNESQDGLYIETSKIYFKHLRGGDSPLQKIPNDFESIKENVEFKNVITTLASDRNVSIQFQHYILGRTIEVRELLASKINLKAEKEDKK